MTNTTRPAEEDGGNAQTIYAFTTYAEAELRLTDSDVVIATVRPGQHAIAMRLAAAWNACAGVSTADLGARRAAPGAAAAAPAELEIKPPYWGAVHTERGGRVELSPQQYRQVLDGAFLRGVDAARAAQAQGGKA